MQQTTLEAGQILAGRPGDVVVLVLVEPRVPCSLRCRDVELVAARPVPCTVDNPELRAPLGVRAGRRYRDVATGLVVRCVRGGQGPLELVRPGTGDHAVELIDDAFVSCT